MGNTGMGIEIAGRLIVGSRTENCVEQATGQSLEDKRLELQSEGVALSDLVDLAALGEQAEKFELFGAYSPQVEVDGDDSSPLFVGLTLRELDGIEGPFFWDCCTPADIRQAVGVFKRAMEQLGFDVEPELALIMEGC